MNANSQIIMRISARGGLSNTLSKVLALPNCDPSAHDSQVLFQSVKRGKVEIVRLLLEDSRVSPQLCDNTLLYSALDNNNIDIAMLLLKDPRVTKNDTKIIAKMIMGHHSKRIPCDTSPGLCIHQEVIKWCVDRGISDPNSLIGFCINHKYLSLLKLCLEHPKAKMTMIASYLPETVSDLEIMKLLLSHPKVRCCISQHDFKRALDSASLMDLEIIKELLNAKELDPKIRKSFDWLVGEHMVDEKKIDNKYNL